MNKPDLSKCATSEDYYKKLARYYQVMYNEQKGVANKNLAN